MASLSSRPSEVFLSDPERREKQRREQALREFYQKNDCVYVGELAINRCWVKIRSWINMQSLMGHLMKNGLVNDADDMNEISSQYLSATTKQTNLLRLLKSNGGGNGHFLFYMSLCESLESNPLGHGDAVDELKRCAIECREEPPWLREVNRNTSFTSIDSSSPLSSTDTSFEMGPQSLPTMSSQTPSSSSSMSMDSSHPSSSGQQSTTATSYDQSKASGQPPQQLPQSHISPSSSGQPAPAHFQPSYQPKLEPMRVCMPPEAQIVANKMGAGEISGPGLLQQSGTKNILYCAGASNMYPMNKEAYTSNEPLSCSSTSSNSKSFLTPCQETKHWAEHSDSTDMDVERDSSKHSRPAHSSSDGQTIQDDSVMSTAERTDNRLTLTKIEEVVTSGDIDTLSEKYDNVIDLEFTTEGNSSNFMDEVCRFVCAVLNARDSKKMGVFLGGVRETELERQPYCVEGVTFDEMVIRNIQQQFLRRLATVLRARVGDQDKELTAEELNQTKLKFVDQPQMLEHRKCLVALLTVEPSLEVCKNHMYVCQFRDSSGRAQTECYKRLEGETVHIRQQKKIAALKSFLYQNYTRS